MPTLKYRNIKTNYGSLNFDSKKEELYYRNLLLLQNAHDKKDRVQKIECQRKYRLEVNGVHVCDYIADFLVSYADGREEVVDVKGYKAGPAYRMFRIKKKLFEAIYPLKIKEI